MIRNSDPMPMPPYEMICYDKECQQVATYKIAARWSDGITGELKTYSIVCEKCLPRLFQEAIQRRNRCRLAPGETLDQPHIYQLRTATRDRDLTPRTDLESQIPAEK